MYLTRPEVLELLSLWDFCLLYEYSSREKVFKRRIIPAGKRAVILPSPTLGAMPSSNSPLFLSWVRQVVLFRFPHRGLKAASLLPQVFLFIFQKAINIRSSWVSFIFEPSFASTNSRFSSVLQPGQEDLLDRQTPVEGTGTTLPSFFSAAEDGAEDEMLSPVAYADNKVRIVSHLVETLDNPIYDNVLSFFLTLPLAETSTNALNL